MSLSIINIVLKATAWEAMGNISSSAEGKIKHLKGEFDVWIKTIRARNNITGLSSLKFRSSITLNHKITLSTAV